MSPAIVDSHCHLDFPELSDRVESIRATMMRSGVSHALCVSVNLENFPRVLALATGYSNFVASVGVHPDEEGGEDPDLSRLIALADHPKIVAIGETGLDYYRKPERAEVQQARFRTHIRAARATHKPLIVHTRSAAADTLRLLREEGAEAVGGVMHCFTETWDVAAAAMNLGFHISFSGIVTFKNARDLQDVARRIPLERMLIETDSPYLAPVPHRGKTNEPGFVRHVAEFIAQLRAVSMAEIAEATTANFFALFHGARPYR
ncbi:MAG: TatD family hydrolase [Burkholderiales bacterium]